MSSENFQLRWIRPARQDRSRDTQQRFVEAAQRLLARGRSFDDISVAELAKEAKSSVGAFYSRFHDKDALLHVLQIELNQEGSATGAHTFELAKKVKLQLPVLVRAFVDLAVGYYHQQRGLRRALLVQMCNNEELRERATELSRETCDGLVDVLRERVPRVKKERLREVVDVAHRIVFGVLDQKLLFGDGTPTGHELTNKALIDELTIAIERYLSAQLGAS